MKGAFFTCGTHVPSARFRAHQFLPHFEAHGIECSTHTAYGRHYNTVLRTPLRAPYIVATRFKRAMQEVLAGRDNDFLFLQRAAFNEVSLPEVLAARLNQRLIFDFDDSIFLHADGRPHPMRRRAFDSLCAVSDHIICGNTWLAKQTGHPHKTTVIPTVIDTDAYLPPVTRRKSAGKVVIGWMGTHGNFPFLLPFVDSMRDVLQRHPQAMLRMVSNAKFEPLAGHPQVEQIEWSAEREKAWLHTFDIGIMPLNDSAVTRGKCGFKMILYMSVGLPVVGSAVGANVDILRESGAGRLVADPSDWAEALGEYIEDECLRRAVGQQAREHAVANYSVKSVLPKYLRIFERVTRSSPRAST